MARKHSYDTKETENMKASHHLFMDSFNIFNQTLTVVSQYTDILKDISHKLQNLYNKSINILDKNPDDNFVYFYTQHLCQIIKSQINSFTSIYETLDISHKKSKEFQRILDNTINSYLKDYNESLKDLTQKYKESEKMKKEFMSKAESTENYMIKIIIDRKKELKRRKSSSLEVNGDKPSNEENNEINTDEEYDSTLSSKKSESTSNIVLKSKYFSDDKSLRDMLHCIRNCERNYTNLMRNIPLFENSFIGSSESSVNSLLETYKECTYNLRERIYEVALLIKSSSAVQLNECEALFYEMIKYPYDNQLKEVTKNAILGSNQSLSKKEQEPYQIKLLGEFNKKIYNIYNKEITNEEANDIVNILGATLKKKQGANYDYIKEKNIFNLIILSETFITEIPRQKPLSQKEKNYIDQLFKEQTYREIFLTYLNHYRARGFFQLPLVNYNIISSLLNQILNTVIPESDYKSAKSVLILSQTFYYLGDNNKQIYLSEAIKTNPTVKEKRFWLEMVAFSLHDEIEHLNERGVGLTENIKTNDKNLNNLVFSQLLPTADNMLEFGLSVEEIEELIKPLGEQFKLTKEFHESIMITIQEKAKQINK